MEMTDLCCLILSATHALYQLAVDIPNLYRLQYKRGKTKTPRDGAGNTVPGLTYNAEATSKVGLGNATQLSPSRQLLFSAVDDFFISRGDP